MLLLITPVINNSQNITISNLIDYVKNTPIIWIILLLVSIIYVICRKDD